MTENTSPHVAGESMDALLAAFSSILAQSSFEEGWWRAHATLTPDVAYPFRRALMRVEAELLSADADQLAESPAAERTADQRRYDAVMALAERVRDAAASAWGAPPPL